MSFWCERFEVKFDVVFQTPCACVFQQQSPTETSFSQLELHFRFWKLCQNVFDRRFWTFLEFVNKMRMNNVYFWNVMVNSNKLNSPNIVSEKFEENVYSEVFCMPPLPFYNSSRPAKKQEKTKLCMLHVQDNLAG